MTKKLYQHRDNNIKVTVEKEEDGSQINAAEFDTAIYVIYNKSTGVEVIRRTLLDGISVIGGNFNVNVPKELITFDNTTNEHWHTMVVGYATGEERPQLFDEKTDIVTGIDL